MIITIDGLAANGKSTLAKKISRNIGFKNFNTGSIYRCITLEIINKNIDISNTKEIINKISNIEIDFDGDNVLLNGINVSNRIREEEISLLSTKWATIFEIKEIVRKIQKNFIRKYNTIIEGRDIGTRIAPDANVRFYLYADFDTRVKRLYKETKSSSIDKIRMDLEQRDFFDINCGNFIKPKEAIEINTTNKNIDEVYEIMIEKINNIIYKNES